MKWHILLLLVLLPMVTALDINHMPFVSEFATNGTTTNLVGDFTNTSTIFKIQPPSNQVWYIARLITQLSDSGQINYDDYGSGITLTNGIIIDYVQNGTTINLTSEPILKNGDLAHYMYDLTYSDFTTGDNYFTGRWTFTKSGVYIKLDGATNDSIRIHLNDDLSGLSTHGFNFQGHIYDTSQITQTSNEETKMLSIAAIIMMGIFLILLFTALVMSRSKMVKFLLLIPINMVVAVTIQLLILFIQSSDSSLTGILNILNILFVVVVVLLVPLVVLGIWAIVKNMTSDIFNKRKKKDMEWDNW